MPVTIDDFIYCRHEKKEASVHKHIRHNMACMRFCPLAKDCAELIRFNKKVWERWVDKSFYDTGVQQPKLPEWAASGIEAPPPPRPEEAAAPGAAKSEAVVNWFGVKQRKLPQWE